MRTKLKLSTHDEVDVAKKNECCYVHTAANATATTTTIVNLSVNL
jgi:hypothetical protein